MKQKYAFTISVLFVIILASGCAKKVEVPQQMPSDFEIYYSFGVLEANVLNTGNNTYTKDICPPPPEKHQRKEYSLSLTEPEKNAIYNSITENDVFNIKDDFTKNCDFMGSCMGVEPQEGATLKITANGLTKTIKWWNNYIGKDDPELKRFQNVEKVIQEIISQREKELGIENIGCRYI